jgi:hypothetical protein
VKRMSYESLDAWRHRSQPLKRTELAPGTTAIPRESPKRARENRLRRTLMLKVRGTPCVVRWDDGCTGIADDGDEILSRARGGSFIDPKNVRGVCRHCHDELTTHPAEAERRGLTLHSWEKGKGA